MSLDFLGPISILYGDVAGNSSSLRPPCTTVIPHDTLYQFLIIPAVICTLILAFTEKRVHRCLECLSGRPSVVFPMDVMGRSNRFSYAAAFGATASLCANVIFYQLYAVEISGPAFLRVFATLLSMLIYGLDYLPLFTALTANSTLGYGIATLYAWALTTITFMRNFWCDFTVTEALVVVARNLPELLCHLYLSVSCPVRFVRSIWRKRNYRLAVDVEDDEDIFEAIRRSYQGLHVRKLFKPPPEPPKPTTGVKEKVKSVIVAIYHKVFYKRLPNFRYSARMLSVSVVGFLLIYEAYVELLVIIVGYGHLIFYYIDLIISETDDEYTQSILGIVIYFVYATYISLITSLTIAFVVGCIMILHTLASYRNLLLGLYKGDNGHLTPKSEKSNSTLLVGSMRYAGYQVAYVAWGYFIQFLVLFLVAIVLAVIIMLIINGIYDWLLTILNNVWPVLLTSLLINIAQKLMAIFAFLQERGKVLALNNRRVFFVVVYFMFFYNIFLGLVSCLLRILKAMALGTLFLPRLDHSTLPRKFQWFDPGFDAFCGFMHMENAHTHPVVLTFISLVEAEILEKKRAKKEQSVETIENGTMMIKHNRRINTVARFKWKLAYTLIKNPQLFINRKDAMMQIFKQKELEVNTEQSSTRI